METFFNFAKASIGAGSFALPWAIMQSGLVAGPVALVLIGILSLYTMRLMLECKHKVNNSLAPWSQANTYADVGKSIASWGHIAVNTTVLLCNLGVCSGYMIFIGLNLQSAIKSLFDLNFGSIGIYAVFLPLLTLLTWLPNFKLLALGAYVGTIFLCLAMGVVYAYGGEIDHWQGLDDFDWIKTESFPLFFGIAAFLFCVHSMVIPLESAMAKPRQMYVVLDFACLIVLLVNLPFAVYGFLMFGNKTAGYVFCNVKQGPLLTTVQLALCLELILTFPIVFFPATQIVEEYFLATQVRFVEVKRRLIRSCLVALSWGVAVGIPVFQLCLSLIGGLTGSTLAFVLPPMFHLILYKSDPSVGLVRRAFHVLIILLGVVAIATTVQAVIAEIIKLYQSGDIHSGDEGGSNSTSCG